jgi:hypothetical protein
LPIDRAALVALSYEYVVIAEYEYPLTKLKREHVKRAVCFAFSIQPHFLQLISHIEK